MLTKMAPNGCPGYSGHDPGVNTTNRRIRPVRHGHPWPPEGPRPRRGAAASQIRPQSTGTRSGDLRPSEAYALPIQGYHLDLSTGACGAVLRSCCSNLFTLSYGTVPRHPLARNFKTPRYPAQTGEAPHSATQCRTVRRARGRNTGAQVHTACARGVTQVHK